MKSSISLGLVLLLVLHTGLSLNTYTHTFDNQYKNSRAHQCREYNHDQTYHKRHLSRLLHNCSQSHRFLSDWCWSSFFNFRMWARIKILHNDLWYCEKWQLHLWHCFICFALAILWSPYHDVQNFLRGTFKRQCCDHHHPQSNWSVQKHNHEAHLPEEKNSRSILYKPNPRISWKPKRSWLQSRISKSSSRHISPGW